MVEATAISFIWLPGSELLCDADSETPQQPTQQYYYTGQFPLWTILKPCNAHLLLVPGSMYGPSLPAPTILSS